MMGGGIQAAPNRTQVPKVYTSSHSPFHTSFPHPISQYCWSIFFHLQICVCVNAPSQPQSYRIDPLTESICSTPSEMDTGDLCRQHLTLL